MGVKRKATRKLDVNQKVEVRSTDSGYSGSWNEATVCASDCLVRRVRYDHIIRDDDSSIKLTESVKVSPSIDGVVSADKMPFSYRGNIRPLPPPVPYGIWQLPYGHCVDYFHLDAWWEGVIFDHDDGEEERSIFFPDEGDVLKVQVSNIRITQDWDEVTEKWKLRGSWMFLEIIEEIERLHPVSVSVRQIWYEVQLKKGFKNLKEWTSTTRDIWRNLVKEVVHENTMLTVMQVFSELNTSPKFVEGGPLLEFSEPALQAILNLETYFNNSAIVPYIEAISNSDSWQMPSVEDQRSLAPNALSGLHFLKNEISGTSSTTEKRSKKRKAREWNRITEYKPEFCPDAISEYNEYDIPGHKITKVTPKVKEHLVYLGWKIECSKSQTPTRYRYISPRGLTFNSLRQVCKMLGKSGNCTEGRGSSYNVSPNDLNFSTWPVEAETCSEVFGSAPPSQEPNFDPVYCPRAVIHYCSLKSQKSSVFHKLNHLVKKDVILNARKHLAAIGWSFFFKLKGENRKEMVYCSPNGGKQYNSLITACKRCIQDGGAELSPSLSTESQLDSVKVCETRNKRKKSDDNGAGIEPQSSACVLRSSKRARVAALSSSSHHTPRTMLSWLIDNNVVLPRAKVQYRLGKDGPSMAVGRITRDGIKCKCCQKVYGISNFEVHAGSNIHRPSANIFLEDGRSLLECQLQMRYKNSVKTTKKRARNFKKASHLSTNDCVCSVCHYGGELLLCDQCPSSFHTACLGMKEVPDGDWFCPSCRCGMCGQSKFDKNKDYFTDSSVLICCQCEHKYHVGCVRNKGYDKLDNYPKGNWFCNKRCEQIFFGIHQLLGKPVMVGVDGLTWTLLKYEKTDDFDSYASDDESVLETYSKLSVALDVMHECFEPVHEPYTRSDLVEDVIFSRWSELNRLNFQGFYTVILERNDEVITVATVRVYGEKVAEVPLVATRFQYRRLGMCRILMDELEKKLKELGVERLVLPAISGVLNAWTTSFGFSEMKECQKLNFLNYTFLDFQGTRMCQKLLRNIPSETRQTSLDHIHSKGNAELDGNSALSEVFQAEQIEGSEIADQGSSNTPGGCETNTTDDPAPLMIIAANQQGHLLCQAEVTDKVGSVKYKCYQRRRKCRALEAKLVLEGVATQ